MTISLFSADLVEKIACSGIGSYSPVSILPLCKGRPKSGSYRTFRSHELSATALACLSEIIAKVNTATIVNLTFASEAIAPSVSPARINCI